MKWYELELGLVAIYLLHIVIDTSTVPEYSGEGGH